MAIVNVQTGIGQTSTGTGTVNALLSNAAVAGNVLIVLVSVNNPTTPPTVTPPGGWVEDSSTSVGNACGAWVFSKVAAGGETDLGTFTCSASRDMWAVGIEYSGLANTTPDRISNNASAIASSSPNTAVTASDITQPDELCIGAIGNINVNTATAQALIPGSTATGGAPSKLGEATSTNGTNGAKVTGRGVEFFSTSPGTVGLEVSISTSRAYGGALATYKAAGGDVGGPTTVPFMVTGPRW